MSRKLGYDEALRKLNDDDPRLTCDDVQAKALRRLVYVSYSAFPGCLPESRTYSRTKVDAVEALRFYIEDGDPEIAPPRGWRKSLRENGWFDGEKLHYSIDRLTLAECIS